MKSFLIIFLLLFKINVVSQTYEDSFKYKATYLMEYKIDSTDLDFIQSENTVLYIGENFSQFSSLGMAVGDSLMKSVKEAEKSPANFARIRAQIPETKHNYFIYKNIPNGKISVTEKIVKDNWRYIEESNLVTWTVKSETKEINGYKTQKAIGQFGGREFVAWFAEEIPISDGPYKFSGLPGLIVQISDTESHYTFELIRFQKLNNKIKFTFNPQQYEDTNRQDFEKVKENYVRNPIGALEKTGMKFHLTAAERSKLNKEHLEEIKSQNNPLELE
jgi:GLPGLI family protein